MAKLTILGSTTADPRFQNKCALGIMTKVPEPGRVKTRLTPPLTSEEAAQLNQCFLKDLGRSIEQASRSAGAVGVGVYTPPGKEDAYDAIFPEGFVLIGQRGDQFGDRLTFAAEDLFKQGFSSVCLINSDSPTVPASAFAEAANKLAENGDRVVLGPSEDGGYYLIGMKILHRRLFEQIDWSTERVHMQTVARAQEIGIPVHQLPLGLDVDDRSTLSRLCSDLFSTQLDVREVAPATAEFLAGIIQKEGPKRIWSG